MSSENRPPPAIIIASRVSAMRRSVACPVLLTAFATLSSALCLAGAGQGQRQGQGQGQAQAPARGQRKVVKSNEEWAKILTQEQFLVTRMKATEPAFSGKFVDNHAKGTYHCVCCEAPLFSSQAKFDSG